MTSLVCSVALCCNKEFTVIAEAERYTLKMTLMTLKERGDESGIGEECLMQRVNNTSEAWP